MVKLFTSLLAGSLLAAPALLAQPESAYNTTLFGHIDPASSSGERYSALTGWTAPNGREYGLLGGPDGTHIIDITDSPIKQVAFIPGPHSGWREMKSYRNYGYVVSEGGHGLQIIDLSKLPASATLVVEDTSHFRTAHTITQQGSYIYVHGTNPDAGANGGTMIFDVSIDPTRPKFVGQWTGRYVHDGTIRNDTLYAAAINNGQLDIVYLGKDRANPRLVTSISYPGAGTHNSDLTPDGSYLMTTDEIGTTPKTLKVWDVRDVGNISKVVDWTPVPGEIIHNVHMKGSIAYIAWYSAGTRIVDMSDPLNPAQIGYFDTYPGAANDYVGNWDVYPFFPSGKIIASDMQTGLYVFTFNNAKRGNIHGTVVDAVTKLPIPNATIVIPKIGSTVTADELGHYSFSGAVDSLPFSATARDYMGVQGALKLAAGSGAAYDIEMSPLVLSTLTITPVDAATGASIQAFSSRVVERPGADARSFNGAQTMKLPQDSTYHIYVGAWGHLPKLVEVHNNSGELRVELAAGYSDDAELDLGWALGAGTDDAMTGVWERGVPIATFPFGDGSTLAQPGEDHTTGFGSEAFITGITGTEEGVGANDIDDGSTSLTSPPMNLTTYRDPYINCWVWYSRDGNTQAIDDTLDLLVSNDNGATWKTLARTWQSTPRAWRPYSFRVKSFVTPTEQTLFRVVASDLYRQSLVEAGLDDFSVVDSAASPSGVDGLEGASVALVQASVRPNPLADHASLSVILARAQHDARIELFDERGALVSSLYHGPIPAGETNFAIGGAGLAGGRYTWRVVLDGGAVRSGAVVVAR
jgi:choice-of-anchor B domain-containing protein